MQEYLIYSCTPMYRFISLRNAGDSTSKLTDPTIVISKIVELLPALDEMGIPVLEEFTWLHFVDNLPPGYEFIKNNLQGS